MRARVGIVRIMPLLLHSRYPDFDVLEHINLHPCRVSKEPHNSKLHEASQDGARNSPERSVVTSFSFEISAFKLTAATNPAD